MKNLIRQHATNLTTAAPYALASGEAFMVGAFFMVASADTAQGAQVVGVTAGEYSLTKAAGETWAFGDKLYWDAANKRLTKTAGSLAYVAKATAGAVAAATSGAAKIINA